MGFHSVPILMDAKGTMHVRVCVCVCVSAYSMCVCVCAHVCIDCCEKQTSINNQESELRAELTKLKEVDSEDC